MTGKLEDHMRILLVDDKANHDALNATMRLEKFSVKRVPNGAAMIAAAQSESFDIILFDVLMPDMSGFDAISQMRANLIEAPICILSEVGNAASKIRALELGADDYIQLPIKAEELTARIEAIIRRASGHIASHLDIGDIRIDNRARVVFFAGNLVPLTNKEFTLLELLANRRGRTISKEGIMSQIYSGHDEPNGKIIDVFICKIRKKLAKIRGDGGDYIATVWGKGYMLRAPHAEQSAA